MIEGAAGSVYGVHLAVVRHSAVLLQAPNGHLGLGAVLKNGIGPHIFLESPALASEVLLRVADGLTQQRHALSSLLDGPPSALLQESGVKISWDSKID